MMKGRNALFAVVLAGASIPATGAHAIDVQGDAGQYVTILFDGCYRIRNNHPSRRVAVVMGPYSFNLQVGENKTLIGFGNVCVTGYVGGNTATFIDPP